ncbi:MAG: methylamine utilization protein [Gammaproteobacteria bacterium]|nr:methylamine utilization protein [Gammaproteobacteria bacterium]MDH5801389.1 methylamine utilization protein [Gammaproteobacteria bacterium]
MKYPLLIGVIVVCLFSVGSAVAKAKGEITILQKDRSFVQDGSQVSSLVVKTGVVLRFENADPFAHNVFSLSPLKKFDLGSYPKGQAKTVVFNKVGTAEIECAIHPQMFLEVTVE